MKRREFLQSSGWFVVGAALIGIPGCGDNNPGPIDGTQADPTGTFSFPQGVASGDPRDASVVLWTRAVRTADPGADVSVRVQVSTDATFATLVVDQAVMATSASDHTVRVLVNGLIAGTAYHYRFVAGQDMITGQTRTAPAATADVQVNLAWVSCQDYTAGHYGAYRQLLVDDDARAPADKIHVVVHLGDMIYETRNDGFQTAIDEKFQAVTLTNRDGQPRALAPFPSGGGVRQNVTFAVTVDDYRHLYKTFLSDPDLQAARARWPFVSIWDDHEFTDDCWQSQANFTDASGSDEGDQKRRVAASQAWFEFVPVQLTGAGGVAGVPSQAKDFAPVVVENAAFTTPNADNFTDEPNNVAAVGAITIYRSLRFGKHVELVMTDERSYRSDHAVPEDLIAAAATPAPGLFLAPRNALPQVIVDLFDQGKTANGGNPPTTILGGALPNPRVGSPVGTMLGKPQKAWWKATMKQSDATWKIWGNEVPLTRILIPKLQDAEPSGRVMSGDAWDGYHTERTELMTYLKAEDIKNVVVISGDIHSSFAGTISDDFNATTQTAVACELVAAGVTSNSLFSFFENATRGGNPLRGLIITNGVGRGGTEVTENFNMLLVNGKSSAGAYAAGASFADSVAARVDVNPHLKYVDTNAQGYGYLKITAAQVDAKLVTINRPIAAPSDAGPGVLRSAAFTIPKDNPAGMSAATFTGTKPFPIA